MNVTTHVKHAVLTNSHVVFIHPTQRKLIKVILPFTLTHIADVWRLGQEMSITHFWVMPDSDIDRAGASFFSECKPYNIFFTHFDNIPNYGRCWNDEQRGHQVYIGYAHRGRFQWKIETPLDILASIDYLTSLLGVTIQWSPGHIGYSLLKKMYSTTERLRSYVRASEIDMQTLPFNASARDVLFKSALTLDMVGKWVHHYDKNSAYLSAARGVVSGCGTPLHVSGNISPERAGIYRVSYDIGASRYNGIIFPLIINKQWVTRDVLHFALSKGYSITIHEAYIFDESHKILDKWASFLWDVRATLKNSTPNYPYEQGRINAYETIKEIACIGVGKLASHYESDFMRPNWWADVVGKARVNLLYNLETFACSGNIPCLIYSDGLWFISDDINSETAIPDILKRKGQLGGYKNVYSIQVTQEMVKASQTLSPGQLVSYFHKKAGYTQ